MVNDSFTKRRVGKENEKIGKISLGHKLELYSLNYNAKYMLDIVFF